MRRFSLIFVALIALATFSSSAYAVQYIAPLNNANQSIGTSNLLFLDNTNGRIGVGTAIPANTLQIGSVGSSGYGGNQFVIGDGTKVTAFYLNPAAATWYTNTNFSMMPSGAGSTGNVGIGTITPAEKLQTVGRARFDDIYVGTWSSAQRIEGNAATTMYVGTGTAQDLILRANGADTVTIKNGGNVGIGTTTPSAPLTIVSNLADGAMGTMLILNSSNQGLSSGGAIEFIGDFTRAKIGTNNSNGGDTDLVFQTSTDSGATLQTQMIITDDGLVGIGGSPSYKLDVSGTGRFTSQLTLGDSTPTLLQATRGATSGSQMILANTYAPTVGSRYSGAETFLASNAYQTTDAADAWAKGSATYSSNIITLGLATSSSMAFQIMHSPPSTGSGTYGTFFPATLVKVMDTGNTGIGTATNPPTRLYVNDSNSTAVGARGLVIKNEGTQDYVNIWNYGTNVYAIESADESTYRDLSLQPHGGNVGIGDTSPTNKLDVAGAIGISDTTVIDASRVGSFATGTTINGQTAWHAGNDGSGSTLDADTIDGNNYNANWPTTLANIQSATTSDFHNIGGTDDDTPDSDAEVPDAHTISGGTIGSNSISGTLTTTGTLTIGDNGDAIVIDASNWDLSSSGAFTVTNITNSGLLIMNAYGTPVSNALISAVSAGSGAVSNGIEFGHPNTAGYRGTLGAQVSSGANFLALNSEGGTSVNTYRTRGIAGVVYRSDLSGGVQWLTLASNADNQAGTSIATLSSAGALAVAGAISGTTINTGNGAMEVNSIAAYTGNQNLGTGNDVSFRKLVLSDDGAASPLLDIVADDTAPWAIRIARDTMGAGGQVQAYLSADDTLTFEGDDYLTGLAGVTATTFTGSLSGNAGTATALAANGANCGAGNYPLGVDASGAVETCTADDDTPDSDGEVPNAITVSGGTIGSNTITAGSAWTTTGTINIDSNTLVVDGANNRVGVLTANPNYPLEVTGNIYSSAGVIASTHWVSDSIRKVSAASPVYFRNSAGTEEMTLDGSGNLGIGISPAEKLDVNGAIKANNHLTNLPWTVQSGAPWVTGYLKLKTPIAYNEGNGFSIKIWGYRYGIGGPPIEIRCGGYAYSSGLIASGCMSDGTSDPVGIGVDTDNTVMITIGSATNGNVWYWDHFTAQYSGDVAHSASGFTWVFNQSGNPSTANTNNVVVNDGAGTIATTGNVGIGVSPSYRLDVSGTQHTSGAVIFDSTLSTGDVTLSTNTVKDSGGTTRLSTGANVIVTVG